MLAIFCIDFNKAEAIKRFKNPEKFFRLNDFKTSPLFSEKEKIALRLTSEITEKNISESTFAQAKNVFSEQELIGIAWVVSSEHVLNLMNLTFGIESDGLCTLKPTSQRLKANGAAL